jgi:hypothetical protein
MPKLSRVARRVPTPGRVARRVPKRSRVAKYINPSDKWIALRTKLREAMLRDERLERAKMADFMYKALPAYTAAEHPSKYGVVEQEADTPVEVPAALTLKRESRNDNDDDDDVETIDLRELGTTPRFRDKQYGILKEGNTLMIGNSVVDLDKPGVITDKGKQFMLTRGLWELLTRNDVDTGTIPPNVMQRYKRIL